jgi:hypothetical protein
MNLIKNEVDKEFKALGFRDQGRHLKTLPQTKKPKVDKERDSQRRAKLPGKRISESGKIYWETRPNRSDKKRSKL